MIPGHALLAIGLPTRINLRAITIEYLDEHGQTCIHNFALNDPPAVLLCPSSLVIVLPESEPPLTPVIPVPLPDSRRIRP